MLQLATGRARRGDVVLGARQRRVSLGLERAIFVGLVRGERGERLLVLGTQPGLQLLQCLGLLAGCTGASSLHGLRQLAGAGGARGLQRSGQELLAVARCLGQRLFLALLRGGQRLLFALLRGGQRLASAALRGGQLLRLALLRCSQSLLLALLRGGQRLTS